MATKNAHKNVNTMLSIIAQIFANPCKMDAFPIELEFALYIAMFFTTGKHGNGRVSAIILFSLAP